MNSEMNRFGKFNFLWFGDEFGRETVKNNKFRPDFRQLNLSFIKNKILGRGFRTVFSNRSSILPIQL